MVTFKEVNLVLLLVSFAVAKAEEFAAELYERPYEDVESRGMQMRSLLESEIPVSAIRKLVRQLESKLMKRSPFGVSCLGAGMSHNCEFNDLKEALKHVEQISSGHFPGRRKRSVMRTRQRNRKLS